MHGRGAKHWFTPSQIIKSTPNRAPQILQFINFFHRRNLFSKFQKSSPKVHQNWFKTGFCLRAIHIDIGVRNKNSLLQGFEGLLQCCRSEYIVIEDFYSTVEVNLGESKDGHFTSTLSPIHFYMVSKDGTLLLHSSKFTSTALSPFKYVFFNSNVYIHFYSISIDFYRESTDGYIHFYTFQNSLLQGFDGLLQQTSSISSISSTSSVPPIFTSSLHQFHQCH